MADMIFGPPPKQANPYGSNPFASFAGMRNPYTGFAWQQPTDETQRMYYSENPQEAMSLWSRANGGTMGGSLEAFLRKLSGDTYADFMRQNMGNPDTHFTDVLTPEKARQAWQQWQGQTAYQRGENPNMFMGAGRRV